jgi:hypothetical protein
VIELPDVPGTAGVNGFARRVVTSHAVGERTAAGGDPRARVIRRGVAGASGRRGERDDNECECQCERGLVHRSFVKPSFTPFHSRGVVGSVIGGDVLASYFTDRTDP